MRGLYAIVDVGVLRARGIDPLEFAEAVLRAKPAMLQLRAKDLGAREVLGLLRAVGPMCLRAGTPLVANDRADLALLAGVGIVHVGQHDVPIEEARRIAPRMDVGVSTHTLSQLAHALEARPAYVAYGPVFATTSKANADPVVGLDGLDEACAAARLANIPLVAIGGITLDHVAAIATRAAAAAVIGALLPERGNDLKEATERARYLHAAFAPHEPTLSGPAS